MAFGNESTVAGTVVGTKAVEAVISHVHSHQPHSVDNNPTEDSDSPGTQFKG